MGGSGEDSMKGGDLLEVAVKSFYCERCNKLLDYHEGQLGGGIVCKNCFYRYVEDMYLTGIVPEIKMREESGFPRYDFYKDRLGWCESVRESPKLYNVLEVKCRYCGKWFVPTLKKVQSRVNDLEHKEGNQSYFYCSKECKLECPIYGKQKLERKYKKGSSRELQPELRQMVFARDGYVCQICGSSKALHCHHITGVEQNPLESADVDNCVTLCKVCHKKVHSERGCYYSDLKKCV